MKPMNLLLLSLLGVLALALMLGAAPATSPTSFEQYEQMSRDELERALSQQYRDRERLEAQVLAELRADHGKQAKLAAICLAGVHRLERVCPELARMIDMYYPYGIITHLPPWTEFPAATALRRIGSPAVPALIENLIQSDSQEVRKRTASVLSEILGPHLAKCAIQEAIDSHGGPGAEASLARLKAGMVILEAGPTTRP